MKDEQPHIIAQCAQCGFRFDILFGVDCPRCRREAVKQAFKPIDPLRTALGVGLTPDAELDGVWHYRPEGIRFHGKLADPDYMRSRQFTGPQTLAKDEDAPKGLRIPKDEAEQIYQLKRMFRL